MNSFVLLLNDENDAVKLEHLLNENAIMYDCDVIGSELTYEFTIKIKYRRIVYLLLQYNDIIVLKFISN